MQSSRGSQGMLRIKERRAAGFQTPQRVNTRRSSLGWPQYDCMEEGNALTGNPIEQMSYKRKSFVSSPAVSKPLLTAQHWITTGRISVTLVPRFPPQLCLPRNCNIPGYMSVTSLKPHNIVLEPSNPRCTCCSTAGRTRHTHSGLSFSDPILQCWQRNLSMFICQSAVSIVVFILQMHLHNIYVLVLLSLTGFPTRQLAVRLAPGNCRFKLYFVLFEATGRHSLDECKGQVVR